VAAQAECRQALQTTSDLEQQLEKARQTNKSQIEKTKQLRSEFTSLKTNYCSQVEELRKKLEAENKNREAG